MLKIYNTDGSIHMIIGENTIKTISFNNGDRTPVLINNKAYYHVYVSTTLREQPYKGYVLKEKID